MEKGILCIDLGQDERFLNLVQKSVNDIEIKIIWCESVEKIRQVQKDSVGLIIILLNEKNKQIIKILDFFDLPVLFLVESISWFFSSVEVIKFTKKFNLDDELPLGTTTPKHLKKLILGRIESFKVQTD